MDSTRESCVLCSEVGGVLLVQRAGYRIVRVEDPDCPAYLRVIAEDHLREMTDLREPEQVMLWRVIAACERVLREVVGVDKVNLASFGNMTPHLHFHVIGRYEDDRFFPNSVWGLPQRESVGTHALVEDQVLTAALELRLP